jgi:hypothetical protein
MRVGIITIFKVNNYGAVGNILDREKNKSLNFLKNAIDG